MNEATFEAQANGAIKNIFPTYSDLEISHQLVFSIKLGHESIDIKPSTKKPRLDILIKQKERNLAILELKRPGYPLKEDDRDQGLSYARLLVPMPPLVIVSNGKETKFYDTITGDTQEITNPDTIIIEKFFSHALEIAANQKDQAIRILLGKDPLIFERVITDFNKMSFRNYLGSIGDFNQPITKSFNLPRQITTRIVDLLSKNNPVISVTGEPMVGKTNVLYELCHLKDIKFIPIYINTEDCQFGILQYLANHFTKHFFITTSTDDVRQWLLHGIVNTSHSAGKIILIIDSVRYSDENIIREINELIELCSSGTSSSLNISCDTSNFNKMVMVSGRPRKSLFGRKALKVEVNNLNDEEFNGARDYLIRHWSADFHKGAHYSMELRNLLLLRMVISDLPNITKENTYHLIPSLLPFRSLTWMLDGFNSDLQFIDDLVKLVTISIKLDIENPSALYSMVNYGRGHVLYDKAVQELGENRINRLLQQGHIDWFNDNERNYYIAPKVPELLAAAAVEVLIKESKNMEFKDAINYILKHSERLPYCDLIAANVFDQLSRKHNFPLYNVVLHLINNPPKIEEVGDNFRGAMYFDRTGMFDIPESLLKESNEDSKIITNMFPWLVLSQLITEPIIIENNEDPWEIYRSILIIIGGYHNILRRIDPVSDPRNVIEYKTHELQSKQGTKGEVLCGEVGIIEPITFALMRGFYQFPNEVLRICQYAVEKREPFLSHRLFNAANSMTTVDDKNVENIIQEALKMLRNVH